MKTSFEIDCRIGISSVKNMSKSDAIELLEQSENGIVLEIVNFGDDGFGMYIHERYGNAKPQIVIEFENEDAIHELKDAIDMTIDRLDFGHHRKEVS